MRPKRFPAVVVLVALLAAIAACGGGGGDNPPPVTYSISGTVTDGTNPLSGVTIALSGAGAGNTTSGVDGSFTLTGLSNGNYTLTPSMTNKVFAPANLPVTVSGANVTGVGFIGTTYAGTPRSISGTVTDGSNPMSGVTISLGGASTASTTTAANGTYTFSNLAEGSYTVTPSKTGYEFAPAFRSVPLSGANATAVDFTGSAVVGPRYSISGQVIAVGGLQGVSVTLGGAASNVTTTDLNGNFSFTNLAAGAYTLTPVKDGYTMSPASSEATVTAANVTGVIFNATAITSPTFTVSGTVSGTGNQGVTMTLSGPVSDTAVTDASGNYSFTVPNGTYMVTPSKTGKTFSPLSSPAVVSGANVTNVNFTISDAPATVWNISGTITTNGQPLQNVTVTISGDVSAVAVTNANGVYSFSGIPDGASGTLTPTREGYTFTPPSTSGTAIGNVTDADFTATWQNTGHSISGIVSYAGGQTGRIYIRVRYSSGYAFAGTSISAPGPFTIRGVPDGTYELFAYMDNLTPATGYQNTANPAGNKTNVTVSGADLTGQDITMTNAPAPATPAPPSAMLVRPGDQSALILWDTSDDGYVETADAYNIYWSTSSSVATSGGTKVHIDHTFGLEGMGVYILSGLTNGSNLYFVMTAEANGAESARSSLVGPITIGAATGNNTVSGTVSIGTTPAGPLFVALVDVADFTILYTRIASPSQNQAYSITGVPDGSYAMVAAVDMNNDGIISVGDLQNDMEMTTVVVSGNKTQNIVLPDADASASMRTGHSTNGSSNDYSLVFVVKGLKKLPVTVALVSGPGVVFPYDMSSDGSDFGHYPMQTNIRPIVGDTYTFDVVYSDGSSETLSAAVGAVIDDCATPTYPIGAVSGATTPTFTWDAPSPAPSFYTYRLDIAPASQGSIWEMETMPMGTLSILYNADGNADPSHVPLQTGTLYYWHISISDAYRNTCSYQATFTP